MRLKFYTKTDCQLCDHAMEVFAQSGVQLELEKIDITRDKGLMVKYGLRIPVIADEEGREIGWPFDVDMFTAWCSAANT